MKKHVLVFDFDGTFTDAEAEGKPFVKGYLEDLCLLLRFKAEEMDLVVRSAEAEFATDPAIYGWKNEQGLIVAPAVVDPYLRIQAVGRYAFDKFGVFLDPSDRSRLLNLLFQRNYASSGTAFKKGGPELLRDLFLCADREIAIYIVTNSDPRMVRKKVDLLCENYPELAGMSSKVIGGAKKYEIGDKPEHLVERITIPGLSRVIYVKRSPYYNILENLREENNIGWEDMTVIGDIFELDLVLPFELGAGVGLVANQFTPQYEIDFINSQRTRPAKIINSLSEVLPFVLR